MTVTVTSCVLIQPPADKVKAYVTVTGSVVVLVRLSAIVADAPLPAVSVMPATDARVQLKEIPSVLLVAV